MSKVYVPIWELDENEFIILTKDMMSEDEEELKSFVWSMASTFVLMGIGTPLRYELIDTENLPHVEAELDWKGESIPIGVLSGPMFEAGESNAEEDQNE